MWDTIDDRLFDAVAAEYIDGMHYTDLICEVEALVRCERQPDAIEILRTVVENLAHRSDLNAQTIPLWWITTGAAIARSVGDSSTELWFYDMWIFHEPDGDRHRTLESARRRVEQHRALGSR
ncbi:hypothetical protein GCM10011410_23140 [Hoyosella rhizosphaerae]|uniref:Uncharacterized protein n=2 Tax=Hoyosella rhizosphaerae TaxID=1755582 RepID=A0A916UER5_9ACTN|nr:hypothetical protein GCM10011410_23140 [Hoyosella rhizosphaerae]